VPFGGKPSRAAENGDVLVVAHGHDIKRLITWHLGWPVGLVPDIPIAQLAAGGRGDAVTCREAA